MPGRRAGVAGRKAVVLGGRRGYTDAMRLTSLFLAFFGCLALSCGKSDPGGAAPAASSASSASPRASASAAVRPMMPKHVTPLPSASAGSHPENCEVEFFGQVKPVEAGKTPPVVFASLSPDCLAPAPMNIGQSSTQPDGKFFLEVFVKWGSDITLCAYQPTGEDKPAKLYGKAAGPFHAEKEGEIEFKNVTIEMKAGAPRPFPRPRVGGAYLEAVHQAIIAA